MYLRVVDVDGAGLALAVEAEELLPDGLGEVQRHVQRADDTRVSVRQEVLPAAERAAVTAVAEIGGRFQRRVDGVRASGSCLQLFLQQKYVRTY